MPLPPCYYIHTYIQNKVTSPKKKNIQQILFLLPKKYDNNAIVWHHLKILLHFWASCFFSVYVLHLLIFTSANPFWLKNDIAIWHWTFFNYNEYALLYYIALVVVFFWQNLKISRIFFCDLCLYTCWTLILLKINWFMCHKQRPNQILRNVEKARS